MQVQPGERVEQRTRNELAVGDDRHRAELGRAQVVERLAGPLRLQHGKAQSERRALAPAAVGGRVPVPSLNFLKVPAISLIMAFRLAFRVMTSLLSTSAISLSKVSKKSGTLTPGTERLLLRAARSRPCIQPFQLAHQ